MAPADSRSDHVLLDFCQSSGHYTLSNDGANGYLFAIPGLVDDDIVLDTRCDINTGAVLQRADCPDDADALRFRRCGGGVWRRSANDDPHGLERVRWAAYSSLRPGERKPCLESIIIAADLNGPDTTESDPPVEIYGSRALVLTRTRRVLTPEECETDPKLSHVWRDFQYARLVPARKQDYGIDDPSPSQEIPHHDVPCADNVPDDCTTDAAEPQASIANLQKLVSTSRDGHSKWTDTVQVARQLPKEACFNVELLNSTRKLHKLSQVEQYMCGPLCFSPDGDDDPDQELSYVRSLKVMPSTAKGHRKYQLDYVLWESIKPDNVPGGRTASGKGRRTATESEDSREQLEDYADIAKDAVQVIGLRMSSGRTYYRPILPLARSRGSRDQADMPLLLACDLDQGGLVMMYDWSQSSAHGVPSTYHESCFWEVEPAGKENDTLQITRKESVRGLFALPAAEHNNRVTPAFSDPPTTLDADSHATDRRLYTTAKLRTVTQDSSRSKRPSNNRARSKPAKRA